MRLMKSILFVAAAIVGVTSVAEGQINAKGPDVRYVKTDGGGPTLIGYNQDSWYKVTSDATVNEFKKTHEDEWSQYLFDESRGKYLQIDLWRKMISYGDAYQDKAVEYTIILAQNSIKEALTAELGGGQEQEDEHTELELQLQAGQDKISRLEAELEALRAE